MAPANRSGASRYSSALAISVQLTAGLMVSTLNPILKFDGYWIISDLSRSVNFHQRLQWYFHQVLRSKSLMVDGTTRTWRYAAITFAVLSVLCFGYLAFILFCANWLVTTKLIDVASNFQQLLTSTDGSIMKTAAVNGKLGWIVILEIVVVITDVALASKLWRLARTLSTSSGEIQAPAFGRS